MGCPRQGSTRHFWTDVGCSDTFAMPRVCPHCARGRRPAGTDARRPEHLRLPARRADARGRGRGPGRPLRSPGAQGGDLAGARPGQDASDHRPLAGHVHGFDRPWRPDRRPEAAARRPRSTRAHRDRLRHRAPLRDDGTRRDVRDLSHTRRGRRAVHARARLVTAYSYCRALRTFRRPARRAGMTAAPIPATIATIVNTIRPLIGRLNPISALFRARIAIAATATPRGRPSAAPISAVMTLSWRTMRRTWRLVVPTARNMPISRVRSKTASASALIIPNRLTITDSASST